MSSYREANGMQGNPYVKREMGIPATVMVLAYEQRTANLIAERDALYLIPEDGRGDGWYALLDNLEDQINARLGITS